MLAMFKPLKCGGECMFHERDFPSAQTNRFKMMIKSYFDKAAAEIGVAGAHVPYIALISKSKDGITQMETTKILGYDKANSSRVVAELENRQIIEKVNEEKRTLLKLTPKGEEVAKKIHGITKEWHKISFEGIDKADREVFLRVNRKMFENCMRAIEEKV